MTDKPIMIDGVDVSGCDFLAKEDDYCSYSGEYRAYKGECGCSEEEMCKDHPNCFYKKTLKQLVRKTQECEELKKKLKYIRDENIHLKESANNEQLDFVALNNYIKTLEFQTNQLKAENDELKREKRNFYNFLTDKYNYGSFRPMWGTYLLKRFFKEDLGDFFDEAAYEMADTIGEKEKQLDRYSQTLTEIKEIAKNMNKECFYDDFDCEDCDMKNGCTYFNKKQILQKISEVE